MGVRFSIAAAAVVGLAVGAAQAKSSATEIEIEPGPSVITPEEAAIVADPKAGIQHGVVLVEEMERNEDHTTNYEYTYHMRAKILSAEARSLGDIVIEDVRKRSDLVKFWAQTILPDGKVLGLIDAQLEERTVAKVKGIASVKELRGALPGIVPGCVIDFGYVLKGEGYYPINRVSLQGNWPIRLLRYRWVPSHYMGAAYVTSNIEGKDVKITTDKSSVLVVGRGLDPVPDEPYTLPADSVRATMVFYYTASNEEPQRFWDHAAHDWAGWIDAFAGKGAGVRDVIAKIGTPTGAPLTDKLRAAYSWVQANIANTTLESAEEAEQDREDDDKQTRKAADDVAALVAAKRASRWKLNYLYAAVARGLGADAQMLYATDRTRHFWLRPLKSTRQFDYDFVAVREMGANTAPYTILDPGSGLPWGQLPWRATGATGLLATKSGAVEMPIHPATPDVNRSSTRATVSFEDGGETLHVKWSRSSPGAGGQDARRTLRGLDPDDRRKKLESMCRGDAAGAEVVASGAPSLDDLDGAFQLSCDVDLGESNLTEDLSRYTMSFKGAWWPDTPYFSSPKRDQPVIFSYPFKDEVTVDVAAPPGFRPLAATPRPTDRPGRNGRYRLSITVRGNGYHVERELTIFPLTVKAEDYDELRSFFQAVDDGDRTPLIFERAAEAP